MPPLPRKSQGDQTPVAKKNGAPSGSSRHNDVTTAQQAQVTQVAGNQATQRMLTATPGYLVSGQSAKAPGPPVVFGIDNTTRRPYLSVTHPGRSAVEVAEYLYGSPDLTPLRDTNPALSDILGPGESLQFPSRSLSSATNDIFQKALKDGTVMRTDGVPDVRSSEATVYKFQANGQDLTLTEVQYVGMLRSAGRWIRLKAEFMKNTAEAVREVRDSHKKDTNSVIRGISDFIGGTSLPSGLKADIAKKAAEKTMALVTDVEWTVNSGSRIKEALSTLQLTAKLVDKAEREWHTYIEATISGAEGAVHALELTRDISFGVAAGLAGAVAAPAVFAAAGGGLLGGGAAVGAGTLIGAGTGGTLEFGSSVAGQGLSMAITPGDQQFDWGYVETRTWTGVKSGGIQGGLGAAGGLAAPRIANVVSTRLFGAPAGALTNTAQRYTVNAVTSAIIGAPSGAGGAALENIDDLIAGRITADEFMQRMYWGGAMGAGLGAATSFVPIHGLYKSGGTPMNPFSGRPVTPRWMMEGFGYSPHQVSPDFQPSLNPFRLRQTLAGRYAWNPTGAPFSGFNALPLDQLPPLQPGHRWVRLNGEWHPMSMTGRFGDPYSLRVQGDNFNFLMGSRGRPQQLVMSRAITRPANNTYANPQGRAQQAVQSFSETTPTGNQPHTPGHNVDLADTSNAPMGMTGELRADPTITNTNVDPYNYTPEPRSSTTSGGRSVSDWGQWLRNNIVREIRGASGGYRQYNAPSSTGRVATGTRPAGAGTVDAPVPDSVIFVRTDRAGNVTDAWRIPFNNPPTSRSVTTLTGANSPYRIQPNQVPAALRGSSPVVSLPVGGEASALQRILDIVVDQ